MRLEDLIIEYKGRTATYEELSSVSGLSKKYLYNNAKTLKDNGITILKSLEPEIKGEDGFIALCSSIHYLEGFPSPYIDRTEQQEELFDYLVENRPSKEECAAILNSIETKELLKIGDNCAISQQTKVLLSRETNIKISKAFKDSLEKEFLDLIKHSPTREQQELIYILKRFLEGDYLPKVHYGYVQAPAGSSKTTCIKALYRLIEKSGKTLHVISNTNTVVSSIGLPNTCTIAKFISNFIGYNCVGKSLGSVSKSVDIALMVEQKEPVDYLIVDEFSVLTPETLSVLKKLANKLIFAGDSLQISREELPLGYPLGVLRQQYRFTYDTPRELTDLLLKGRVTEFEERLKSLVTGTYDVNLALKANTTSYDVRKDYNESFDDLVKDLGPYHSLRHTILIGSKEGAETLNSLLNQGPDIKEGSKVKLERTDYRVGKAIKGSFYTVLKNTGEVVFLHNPTIGWVEAKPSDVSLAYVLTYDNSQGLEWDTVDLILDSSSSNIRTASHYVGVTRARNSFKAFSLEKVVDTITPAITALMSGEGSRNDQCFRAILSVTERMVNDLNLPESEIVSMFNRVLEYSGGSSGVSSAKETPPSTLTPVIEVPVRGSFDIQSLIIQKDVFEKDYKKPSKVWGIANTKTGNYPKLEECNKVKQHAQRYLSSKKDDGWCLTRDLRGLDLVVFDFDSRETVEAMIHWADYTEAYISEDNSKMHLVFTTNHYWKRMVGHTTLGIPIDVLGNDPKARSLQNFKPNKSHNGRRASRLPQEFLDQLNILINNYLKTHSK